MNENLNLIEILKDCPKGTKLYSTVFGEVEFEGINDIIGPIIVTTDTGKAECFTADGKMYTYYSSDCLLFPSREQRDWSKFKSNKPKFNPKTLQPYMKVLVRDNCESEWQCDLFSYITDDSEGFPYRFPYRCVVCSYRYCIPYNDDTKHLVGTTDEAPEFYRYWED